MGSFGVFKFKDLVCCHWLFRMKSFTSTAVWQGFWTLHSSGRGVEWDAVELPSQFMENWWAHHLSTLNYPAAAEHMFKAYYSLSLYETILGTQESSLPWCCPQQSLYRGFHSTKCVICGHYCYPVLLWYRHHIKARMDLKVIMEPPAWSKPEVIG